MKTGSSTGGIEQSNAYRRKKARQRRDEEKSWAAKNGPVVSYVDESVRRAPQSPDGSDRAAGDTSE